VSAIGVKFPEGSGRENPTLWQRVRHYDWLVEATRYLSPGSFVRWVRSEVGTTPRTIQDDMKVLEWSAVKDCLTV
jgi:hypothetical protein